MAIQKKQLSAINTAISKLIESGAKSKALTYALVKNIKKLEPEIEALNKALETDSDEFKSYVNETRGIYEQYVDKDEQGNFKLVQNGVILKNPEDRDIVQGLINDLDVKYKDAILARNEELNKYNEILEEVSEIDFVKIKLADLPEEVTGDVIYILDDLIEA